MKRQTDGGMSRRKRLISGSIRGKRARAAAAVLALAIALTASPAAAKADSVAVPGEGSTDGEVTATFSITEDMLPGLGYGVVASIPVSMALAYDTQDKTFSNSAAVYCSGVLADGRKVSVTVDGSSDKYGKVYDEADRASSVKVKTGFSVSMSKTSWSKAECMENLEGLDSGGEAAKTGELSVSVPGKGFIPSGTGTFRTYVPLVIRQEAAD